MTVARAPLGSHASGCLAFAGGVGLLFVAVAVYAWPLLGPWDPAEQCEAALAGAPPSTGPVVVTPHYAPVGQTCRWPRSTVTAELVGAGPTWWAIALAAAGVVFLVLAFVVPSSRSEVPS